ncbi:hypothetical protein NC653_009039 [Populus alba x Populus x berolinensis]|uniref:Remorin C-terminal domain-containing protein n=1 Tax=Populus alba x Populus x berolinensis TaxID=444605 RepID=A0AAD6WB10_9ROSI|nr:hypothetical protein NC653_009039 [Populus alba x Populus x berolinensis]
MQRFSGNISVKVKVVAKWPKSSIQPLFLSFSLGVLSLVSSEDCTSVSKGHPPVCGTLFSFQYFMGEEEHEKAESKAVSLPTPAKEHGPVQEEKEASLNDAANEKSLVPVSEKAADPTADESVSGGSNNREHIDLYRSSDAILSRVETEKRCALIKAWVENEKAKVENKAHKKLSAIGSWETTKKVSVEAKIQKFEEKLERKKAEYAEKMKNRAAELHKTAEEKKAMIEAKKSEECLKVEETAAKFRATGSLSLLPTSKKQKRTQLREPDSKPTHEDRDDELAIDSVS